MEVTIWIWGFRAVARRYLAPVWLKWELCFSWQDVKYIFRKGVKHIPGTVGVARSSVPGLGSQTFHSVIHCIWVWKSCYEGQQLSIWSPAGRLRVVGLFTKWIYLSIMLLCSWQDGQGDWYGDLCKISSKVCTVPHCEKGAKLERITLHFTCQPHLWSHKMWVVTKRMRLQMQAAELLPTERLTTIALWGVSWDGSRIWLGHLQGAFHWKYWGHVKLEGGYRSARHTETVQYSIFYVLWEWLSIPKVEP